MCLLPVTSLGVRQGSTKPLQVQVQVGTVKMTNTSDISHWDWNQDAFRDLQASSARGKGRISRQGNGMESSEALGKKRSETAEEGAGIKAALKSLSGSCECAAQSQMRGRKGRVGMQEGMGGA